MLGSMSVRHPSCAGAADIATLGVAALAVAPELLPEAVEHACAITLSDANVAMVTM
jgi:hypothetical protein